MATQEDLTVPYHQQDTSYYCGAACAQMVLASPGVDAGILDQDDLYADNHAHSTIESGWASAPDGLTWTMNDRRPASFNNSFVLFALDNEEAISRKICWTIHHYNVAPISLVYGAQHWIVVRGFDASDAPSSSGDTSYSITAFDVNNPWPPCPSLYNPADAPPPPHSNGDGCGGGGDRGVDNEHITYATWQADYMTGVTFGHWNGKFVAVCDPEPPANKFGRPRKYTRRLKGDKLIKPRDAIKYTEKAFESYGLLKRKEWGNILKKASPGEPLLVQRLDHNDSFYYIVPMQSSSGASAAAFACIDARFGDYRQAAMISAKSPAAMLIDRKGMAEWIFKQKIVLPESQGRIQLRPEGICLHPTLVWKPCRESLSPFWPFFMYTYGAHRIYVRIDRKVFTRLTVTDKGI